MTLTHLRDIIAVTDDIPAIAFAQGDFHERSRSWHDNCHRYAQLFSVVGQCQSMVARGTGYHSFRSLFLQKARVHQMTLFRNTTKVTQRWMLTSPKKLVDRSWNFVSLPLEV